MLANPSWLFVAIVYVLGIAAAHRCGARIPFRVAALFILLVFGFLFRPLTQPVVNIPSDVIRLLTPWSAERAPARPPFSKYDVSNMNLHDIPMQTLPWMHQVRESWRSFEVPLWNASAGAGYPLLANGQSVPFSPLRLLTLPLSLSHAIAAEAALKLLLSLVLTFLFCRRRYSEGASVLAAIVWTFSTFMMTWLHFPIASAAALLPGVWLVIEQLFDGFTRERFLAATLLFATTVLAGHPETVFNIGLIAAAHGLWIAITERRFRPLLHVGAASFIAALLTAPFLLPFAEAALRSQRFAETRVATSIVPPYSDFPCAILLLQPRFHGSLPQERPWGPASLESVSGFAGVFAIASLFAMSIYLIRSRNWREREVLYVIGFIFSLGVVLAWPGITEIFHAIAGLAPPMRMRLALCWFGALLAAAAIDRAKERPLPLFAGVVVVASMMLWLMRTTAFPTPSHSVTALLSFLPSIAVLACAALFAGNLRVAAVIIATIAELCCASSGWNPVLREDTLYPRTPLITALTSLPHNEPFRIVGIGDALYPNTAAMFGLEDVRVHDPMADARYVQYLTKNIGWNAADYYAKWTSSDTSILDFLNVKYIITAGTLGGSRYALRYEGRDGRIYENLTARPRFFSDAAHITIKHTGESSYRLHVSAKAPASIVSSIPYWPGWRARANGQALNPTTIDGLFFGFTVPAGEHDIDVSYAPASFRIGVVLALLALIALAAWWRAQRNISAVP